MLKRTPFHDLHVSMNARLVDFAGWEMPLVYRGINEEHQQTRESGSLFDVSHMGRLHFSGEDALAFLDRVLTRRISDQGVGQSRYSLVCNEKGGVLDDVILSRDARQWILVCNASNRAKLVSYFTTCRRQWGMDFDLADQTEGTAMVALQGPKVLERLSSVLDLRNIKRYHFETRSIMLMKFMVFRSGYTGEDGVEIILPASMAGMAVKLLGGRMDKPDATLKPAGLGARDTLRLEAGMPLYGHELSETIDPLSAGLGWAVDLQKDFVGAATLRTIAQSGPKRKLVGIELDGRRIARQDSPLVHEGATVGGVTSGTFSPTLQKSIAMAFVDAALATPQQRISVDLKGNAVPATIVPLPFYRRGK